MNLFKSFSIYTLTSILTAGIPFLVLPVLTFYLSPADYGVLRLINVYVTLLIPFISLITFGLANREYFTSSNIEFSNLFSTISWIPILTSIFFIVVFFLFRIPLSNLLEIPKNWMPFLPILALVIIIWDVFANMLIIKKNAKLYASTSISKSIIDVGFTLILVVVFSLNWQGRILSSWLANILLGVVAIRFFIKQRWLKKNVFSNKWLKQSLIYGIPLIPHTIGRFVINQSDSIFIAKMVSIEETGIYAIGYQFGFIISIVSGAFLNIYSPFLYERLASINYKKKIEIVKLSYIFIGVLILLTILLSIGAEGIFAWIIDERYALGFRYVFWIALSYLFWGGYLIFAGYIFYLKKTVIMAYVSIVNVGLNIALNYYLILNYGVIGAAYATTISFFVTFVIVAFISNRLYPMPWFYFLKSSKTS